MQRLVHHSTVSQAATEYSCDPRLAGLAQRKADPVGLWQQQQQQGASNTNSFAADLESIAQSGTTFTTSHGAAAGKLPSTAGAAASATLGLLGAALLTKPLLPPQFCVSTSHAKTCLDWAQLLTCCQTPMLPSCQALPTWTAFADWRSGCMHCCCRQGLSSLGLYIVGFWVGPIKAPQGNVDLCVNVAKPGQLAKGNRLHPCCRQQDLSRLSGLLQSGLWCGGQTEPPRGVQGFRLWQHHRPESRSCSSW